MCYHVEGFVIMWDEMLSSGTKVYHLELMLSSGMKCYHVGRNVFNWSKCYHTEAYVIMRD